MGWIREAHQLVRATARAYVRAAVNALEQVWANFHVEQVFRADTVSMLRAGLHWLLAFVSSGVLLPPPKSLFDNSPLRELLSRTMSFRGVHRSIAKGRLRAVGICRVVGVNIRRKCIASKSRNRR